MSASKEISVITPVFNGEKYIRDCIESVQGQAGILVEHIVVDDGSTDRTAEIVSEYENVALLRQARKGAAAARNKGLQNSSAKYIKFLDADDLLVANSLSRQFEVAQKMASNQIVYGCSERVGESAESKTVKRSEVAPGGNALADLILRNIQISLPLYPRDSIAVVGGFDERLFARQEWNLHLKLVCAGYEFKMSEDLIFRQRFHDDMHRISNRELVLAQEMRNIEHAIEIIPKDSDEIVFDALAAYLWGLGRQFLVTGNKEGALAFFERAGDLSTSGYRKFLGAKYRIISAVLGPIYGEELFIFVARLKRILRR